MLSKLLAQWSESSPQAIRRRIRSHAEAKRELLAEYMREAQLEDEARAELRSVTAPTLTITRKEVMPC